MYENLVDLSSLRQAAIRYNPELYTTMVISLQDVSEALRINVIQTNEDDEIKTLVRRGHLLRPYDHQFDIKNNRELLKIKTYMLKLKRGYINLYDDITLYEDKKSQKKVLFNRGIHIDPQMNNIPLESIILTNATRTLMEDIVFAMFFAKRNETGTTPLDCFDGFNTIIDNAIVDGEISANLGNYVPSGSLAYSDTGTNAYDNLLKWLRKASPKMRAGRCVLRITNDVMSAVLQAYKVKVNNFSDPDWATVTQRLQEDGHFRSLEICTHVAMGYGDRIFLTGEYEDPQMRDLFDFGIDYTPDVNIFQVRAPFENPNYIQYYSQPKMGTRIKGFSPHVFMMNEGVNTPMDLSGDYKSNEIWSMVNPDQSKNISVASLGVPSLTANYIRSIMYPNGQDLDAPTFKIYYNASNNPEVMKQGASIDTVEFNNGLIQGKIDSVPVGSYYFMSEMKSGENTYYSDVSSMITVAPVVEIEKPAADLGNISAEYSANITLDQAPAYGFKYGTSSNAADLKESTNVVTGTAGEGKFTATLPTGSGVQFFIAFITYNDQTYYSEVSDGVTLSE